jgi:FkbM family methyltransferase
LSPAYALIDYLMRICCHKQTHIRETKNANWGKENILRAIGEFNEEFFRIHRGTKWNYLRKEIITKSKKESFYDFNGIKIPLVDPKMEETLGRVFDETILPYVYFNNHFYESLHKKTHDVYYGLEKIGFKVSVELGDVVFDVGSWVGDFAAYASRCGAIVYAFEPTPKIFNLLSRTAELNANINPVNLGLSDKKGRISMYFDDEIGGNNSYIGSVDHSRYKTFESEITTLDDFVEENCIDKVDFIKADIEGFERNMLRGAARVLRRHAPKLAICTYHLIDDPDVLEGIIKDVNPDYRVVHMPKILFAAVDNR